MQLNRILLTNIQLNPDNPNHHDEAKIETLAANIKEFGLINPVTVKRLHPTESRFELLAGEGRYRAFEKLMREAPNPKQTSQWSKIPAVVLLQMNEGESRSWGVRLSENKIRSFNWQAECVCFAKMRLDGKSLKDIGVIFGLKDEKDITRRVALGEMFIAVDIKNSDSGVTVSFGDAIDYLLPLRLELGRDPENGNRRLYDYTEVFPCIILLSSGELKSSDLPAYTPERRIEILRGQQEALTTQRAGCGASSRSRHAA